MVKYVEGLVKGAAMVQPKSVKESLIVLGCLSTKMQQRMSLFWSVPSKVKYEKHYLRNEESAHVWGELAAYSRDSPS